MTDIRERIAKALCLEREGDNQYWQPWLPEADAVLAELGLTQAEPVAYVWIGSMQALKAGERPVEALLWTTPTGQAGVPLYTDPQPQPQAGVVEARPLSEWCEDFGPVTWWKLPVEEAAWIGTPNDDDWPGYHTHWTAHPPVPSEAAPQPQAAPNRTGMTYYRKTECKAASAEAPDCICWTPAPQASAEDVETMDRLVAGLPEREATAPARAAWPRLRASLGVGRE